MRRTSATLLLLVFLSIVSAPLLSGFEDPYKNLPACCRKGGKHHCVMQGMVDQSPGTHLSAPAERCPLFPKTPATGARAQFLFAPGPSSMFFAALASHPAIAAQSEARYRISFDRARLKRGPPVSSTLHHS